MIDGAGGGGVIDLVGIGRPYPRCMIGESFVLAVVVDVAPRGVSFVPFECSDAEAAALGEREGPTRQRPDVLDREADVGQRRLAPPVRATYGPACFDRRIARDGHVTTCTRIRKRLVRLCVRRFCFVVGCCARGDGQERARHTAKNEKAPHGFPPRDRSTPSPPTQTCPGPAVHTVVRSGRREPSPPIFIRDQRVPS